ncbi:MAG: DSD1 family PLP-dependent enzyme [Alphaproteobacteria bacterium]|nr:DSD1 family PLP-dependent enzyme [Alphaproteobacteria bacterium]MDP6814802.1 DSD1 family PLP-dependent enzyme [Alphaproteobacteria bacterium]
MSEGLGANAGLIGQAESRAALLTPALVLDLDALEANIAAMAAWADGHGLRLRPHGKSHKSPEIARRQAAAGAVGICCASLREAQVMAAARLPGILITTPLAPAKAPLVAALGREGADIACVVDHPDLAEAYLAAAEGAGTTLKLFVDLDPGVGRTGVLTAEAAIDLAGRIAAHPYGEYAGLQGYMGNLQHVDDLAERAEKLIQPTAGLRAVVAALGKANLPPAIVTGGGTGTHRLDAGHGTLGELQAGSYLFMDVQYLSVEQSADGGQPYRPALFVQASVVNVNHPRYAVTDAGLKSFATDGPAPLLAAGAPAGASYRYMGDEHGAVVFADPGDALELGAKVECVVPHCDPNVNLFDHYHVVQGDRLVDIWPVAARGNP